MLRDIPDGTHCFIDANIFYYHLVNTPPLSDECSNFQKRIERRELSSSTSATAVAEAIHKVMLAEAVARHGLDRKGLAHKLQRQSHLLATLSQHKQVTEVVQGLNIHVEATTLNLLVSASDLSIRFRLLTNDALTIAVMEKMGLTNLATNDDNFDALLAITIWKPR